MAEGADLPRVPLDDVDLQLLLAAMGPELETPKDHDDLLRMMELVHEFEATPVENLLLAQCW